MYNVYKHVNKINNKIYIGITKQLPEKRWGIGGKNYKNKCPHFWAAIEKYGWDNFSHIIIATGLSKDSACELEIKLIKQYNTTNSKYGYNITEGGSAPFLPEETRRKMSLSMIGNKHGLGKPCSNEKKEKIKKALQGKPFTETHRQNISKAKKGKPTRPCPEETKIKISNSHKKKPVFCQETNTIYESIQACSRELNIPATSICAVCKNKHKHYKNYHFNYLI